MLYLLAAVKVKGKKTEHVLEMPVVAPSGTSETEIREHILKESAGGGSEWDEELESQMTANGHTEVIGSGGMTHTILALHKMAIFDVMIDNAQTKMLLPFEIDSLLDATPIVGIEGANPYFITMLWDENGHENELNNIVWAKDIDTAKREALLLECHPSYRDEVCASEAMKSFVAHDSFGSFKVEKAEPLRVAHVDLIHLKEGENHVTVYLFDEPLDYSRGLRPLLPLQCRKSPYEA